jgi:DnaJ-like protein
MPEILLLLVGGALLGLWLLARAFLAANPAQIAQGLRWGGVFAGFLAIVGLVVTGRLPQALTAAAALFPAAARLRSGWHRWRAANGPAAGRTSEIETDWLKMSLDHDTGTMTGTVRRGRLAGRRLDEAALPELVELLRDCRVDDESSARLLETYLDRCFPDWRGTAKAGDGRGASGRPAGGAAMTRDEAYEVLGLSPGASEAEIRAAHRRLMAKLHPDKGGSTWLAARINLARDKLLEA